MKKLELGQMERVQGGGSNYACLGATAAYTASLVGQDSNIDGSDVLKMLAAWSSMVAACSQAPIFQMQ